MFSLFRYQVIVEGLNYWFSIEEILRVSGILHILLHHYKLFIEVIEIFLTYHYAPMYIENWKY